MYDTNMDEEWSISEAVGHIGVVAGQVMNVNKKLYKLAKAGDNKISKEAITCGADNISLNCKVIIVMIMISVCIIAITVVAVASAVVVLCCVCVCFFCSSVCCLCCCFLALSLFLVVVAAVFMLYSLLRTCNINKELSTHNIHQCAQVLTISLNSTYVCMYKRRVFSKGIL
jgi:hypothetical protein